MPIDPHPPESFHFIHKVERFYTGLIAAAHPGQESGLGGKLLYAGKLSSEARALVVAGNIAGAASLAAAADTAAQKQAIRDGVADFLVTNLDEALRILKNQIRKREPVAVCIAADPETVEREMLSRGVEPDMLAPDIAQFAAPSGGNPRRVVAVDLEEGQVLVGWSVAAAPTLWLPKLDALAARCIARDAWSAHRWLRLVPRYMNRLAVRLLRCDERTALCFLERVDRAELGVLVEIQVRRRGDTVVYKFAPPDDSDSAG